MMEIIDLFQGVFVIERQYKPLSSKMQNMFRYYPGLRHLCRFWFQQRFE